MGASARNRVQQLIWEAEEEERRAQRRHVLCQLDGLLTQLEEINLRGGEIPPRIVAALRRCGVEFPPIITPPELIEAIFAAQERFMREPVGRRGAVERNDRRDRMAS
ncbi:MAG TPA: hypothetical protein VE219_04185 [Candidatus Sulfotelmatobacter sp.]|nr:hypothetical protein [Candidatus Sulfotelmatobacter sp.]